MEDFRGKSLQEKIDSIKKEFQDVATNISVGYLEVYIFQSLSK